MHRVGWACAGYVRKVERWEGVQLFSFYSKLCLLNMIVFINSTIFMSAEYYTIGR